MNIKHIFFDLDRTLWDFNANSRAELQQLWEQYQLHQKGISLPDEFIKIYEKINAEYWSLYRSNQITKEKLRTERFYKSLLYFGIDDEELALQMANDYVRNSPNRTIMIPYSYEILDYLKDKYHLHIITNGFKEVQQNKIKNCKLSPYFETFTSSEEIGVTKPNPKIFSTALNKASAQKEESVYIGDDFIVDIQGATDFGMHAIYFNPHKKQHNLKLIGDVDNLSQIKKLL